MVLSECWGETKVRKGRDVAVLYILSLHHFHNYALKAGEGCSLGRKPINVALNLEGIFSGLMVTPCPLS